MAGFVAAPLPSIGILFADKTFAASASGVAAVTGAAAIAARFSVSPSGVAAASNPTPLSVIIGLASAALSVGATTGNMSGGIIALGSAAAGAATASPAGLQSTVAFASSPGAVAASAAAFDQIALRPAPLPSIGLLYLDPIVYLFGAAGGIASADADVHGPAHLDGSAAGQAAVSGDLSVPKALTGAAAAGATVIDAKFGPAVDLFWDRVAGNEGYKVQYGTTAGGPYPNEVTLATDVETLTLWSLAFSTQYYWRVTALVGGNVQTWSDEAQFDTFAILQTLAGAASAVSTASGNVVRLARAFSGVGAGIATTTVGATVIRTLGASAVSAATVGDDIAVSVRIDAAALNQALASAGVTKKASLEAPAYGTADAAAEAQLGTGKTFGGVAYGEAVASGDIQMALTFDVTAVSDATAHGVTGGVSFASVAAASAQSITDVHRTAGLAGSGAASSAADGGFGGRTLGGSATAEAYAGGTMMIPVRLGAAALAQANALGFIEVGARFGADATAMAITGADIQRWVEMAALADAAATAGATFQVLGQQRIVFGIDILVFEAGNDMAVFESDGADWRSVA